MPICFANVVPLRQKRYTVSMNYSAIQTAELFNVARETIRKWAIEFDLYLSPSARPESGGIRRFTQNDLEIFALIAEMKGQGKVFDDIHAALRAGQRGIVPDMPIHLTTQPNQQELVLTERIHTLETELEKERAARNKAEGKVELLEKQVEKLQERLFRRDW